MARGCGTQEANVSEAAKSVQSTSVFAGADTPAACRTGSSLVAPCTGGADPSARELKPKGASVSFWNSNPIHKDETTRQRDCALFPAQPACRDRGPLLHSREVVALQTRLNQDQRSTHLGGKHASTAAKSAYHRTDVSSGVPRDDARQPDSAASRDGAKNYGVAAVNHLSVPPSDRSKPDRSADRCSKTELAKACIVGAGVGLVPSALFGLPGAVGGATSGCVVNMAVQAMDCEQDSKGRLDLSITPHRDAPPSKQREPPPNQREPPLFMTRIIPK